MVTAEKLDRQVADSAGISNEPAAFMRLLIELYAAEMDTIFHGMVATRVG